MHHRLRAIALLSIVVVIAAACSKPKQQVGQTGASQQGGSALTGGASSAPGAPGAKGGGTGGGGGNSKTPTQNGYASNPQGNLAQQRKIGGLIHLQSTSYSNPNTWTGVTKDTIKLNFGVDKS